MKNKYYALFSCDQWKSHSSMSLIGVFTLLKLRSAIRKRIKSKNFSFDGYDIKEIKNMSIHDLDIALQYGSIIELSINETLD